MIKYRHPKHFVGKLVCLKHSIPFPQIAEETRSRSVISMISLFSARGSRSGISSRDLGDRRDGINKSR